MNFSVLKVSGFGINWSSVACSSFEERPEIKMHHPSFLCLVHHQDLWAHHQDHLELMEYLSPDQFPMAGLDEASLE